MKQRGHKFPFWGMGHFLALMLLLLAILVVAPGAAQQTGDAVSVAPPIAADSPPEAQNSAEQGFAPQTTISSSAKGASSSHEAKTPPDLNWERVEREFAHQLDLVKKDIENIRELFSGMEWGFTRIEILIAIATLAFVVAGGFSIQTVIRADKRAERMAEKRVDEFLARKEPEIDKRVEEIGREAAQRVLKWAQDKKRAEEKTKQPESDIGHPDIRSGASQGIRVAAALGNPNKIEQAVNEGASIDEPDSDGDTPLLTAMFGNNPQAAGEKLIELGANVNVKNRHGLAPIHIAAVKNLVPVLSLLADNGADIETRDENDNTPLLAAAVGGAQGAAEKLIDLGANVAARNKSHYTPLHAAVGSGMVSAIPLLVDKGADINAKDEDGDTPLLVAAFAVAQDAVEELIKCGADVSVESKKKYTPLHVAAARGMEHAIPLLVDKGADINARDEDGDTPLDVAVGLGKYAAADNLQKRGGKRGKDL